ncbi:MAG: HAMP domain-containing histidine kinase [Acidobacteria bacterium]|nr:HAMP domain-containing histidine kinase [Acidobacteriota bacterium]
MDKKYEFDLSRIDKSTVDPNELVRKAVETLNRYPQPFAATFTVNGKKFVIGGKRDKKILIDSLDGISSLLTSRSMLSQLQRNALTHIRGLNHNLRGSLSGIRSRLDLFTRELKGGNMKPAPENSTTVPVQKIEEVFGKLIHSADNLQKQLSDFEQVISWLDPEHDICMLLPNQVLETIIEYMITDLFVKKEVTISIQPQPPVRSVTIHPMLFVEPILHILENAVQSLRCRGGGNIRIMVSSSGSDCIVEIHNNGPRISEELLQPSLFEPGTGDFENGPGMGLAFSKWLTETAGGELSLLQNEDSNVAFRLRYPRRP